MAKQKNLEFRVPYTVYFQGRVYSGIWETLAVTVDEAEAHARYALVLWKNKDAIYRGGIIEFGDTQTVDGQRPRAKKSLWKKLQETMAKMGVKMSDSDAKLFQKQWHIGVKNMEKMAKEIAIKYYGMEEKDNEDKD